MSDEDLGCLALLGLIVLIVLGMMWADSRSPIDLDRPAATGRP